MTDDGLPTEDLDRFYRLRAKMKAGFRLDMEEAAAYRRLGRAWISVYKSIRDDRGVGGIRRDLNMLKRKRGRKKERFTDGDDVGRRLLL